MTFAIAGVTGNTGKVAAESLLAQGKKVRVIVRDAEKGAPWKARGAEVALADLADARALSDALRGATGAYLLVPPNMAAPDFRAYQDGVTRALAEAVRAARVPHVVLLSSVGAQHPSGTGPIAGLHATEHALRAIDGVVLSSVRAAYFLENLGGSLGPVKDAGVLPSFFPEDFAFPMIGTGDIGRLAARLLVEPPSASQIVELGTDRSFSELARALAKILGKEVNVHEVPLDAVAKTLEGVGLPPPMASLYAEMSRAVLERKVAWEGGHGRVEASEPLEQVLKGLLGV